MEALTFNLQIDMFTTNTDDWESQDIFWCIFNSGCFRNTSSGNCQPFEDDFWKIGQVQKNRYNSHDLIREANDSVYRDQDEALKALAIIDPSQPYQES